MSKRHGLPGRSKIVVAALLLLAAVGTGNSQALLRTGDVALERTLTPIVQCLGRGSIDPLEVVACIGR